jgi:hypothetical protein
MQAIFNKESKFIKAVINNGYEWTNNPHEALLFDEKKTPSLEECIRVNVEDVRHMSKQELINDFSICVAHHDDEKLIEEALLNVTGKKWIHTKGILSIKAEHIKSKPMGHDDIYNYITSWGLTVEPIVWSINELSTEKFHWASDNGSRLYSL